MPSYKKAIIFPLLIASFFLIASMIWIFFAMSQLVALTANKDMIDEQRYNIIALSSVISDAESGQRGYLLTSNVTFLEAFDIGKTAIENSLARIDQLNKHFPELVVIFSHIRNLVDSKFNLMNKGAQVQLQAGAYASHLTLAKDTGKLLMTEIKLELSKADKLLYEARLKDEQGIEARVRATLLGAAFLLLLIIGILAYSYKRTLALFEKVLEGEVQLDSLSYQATHDSLTELVNRRGFEEYFQKHM